jgi:hypothetical protein
MTDFSPAAQAVLDAFLDSPVDAGNYYATRSRQIAAALRAAADQRHSQEIREADYTTRRWICVDELLGIAAELEGSND